MAWTTTSNVSAGSVLTATAFNNQVLGNLNELRGDWAQFHLTTGNLTLNSTSWANLSTATDLTLAAEAGDVVEVGISALVDANGPTGPDLYLDAVTLVSTTVTNSFASNGAVDASGQGILGWRANPNVLASLGCPFFYKLVSGDVSGGNVTIRFRYRTSAAANRTMFATSGIRAVFTARNHGQVEI